VVRREIQAATVLAIPHTSPSAIGWINWSGVMASSEATDMATLYAQCRVVSVTVRFCPTAFNGTSGSAVYTGVRGAVAHDPTGLVFSVYPTSYADLIMLPRSRLWACGSMGGNSWGSLSYRAPRGNSQDLSPLPHVSAGVWMDAANATNMVGVSYFAGETIDAVVNSSTDQQVLSVVIQFVVEYRQPRPVDAVSRKTHAISLEYPEVKQRPSSKAIPVAPLTSLKEESKEFVVVSVPQPRRSASQGPSLVRKGVG